MFSPSLTSSDGGIKNGDVASAAPANVDVLRLLSARTAEMMACEASVHHASARAITQLQRLPVRLRRRAASHQAKRLPRRLHHNPTHPTTQKLLKRARRCRRYRRRPQRLAVLAARRCSAVVPPSVEIVAPGGGVKWIPTALWHAKRFHVVENWGWRIPYAPTDKMFKALQRATTERCMLLDHGYLSCFSLRGPVDLLKRCLAETTLPFSVSAVSSDLPSVATSTGFQETVGLFCRKSSKTGTSVASVAALPNISRLILGPVRILWSPTDSQNCAIVWLWLHPAMSSDAWKLLKSLDYLSTSSANPGTHILQLVNCTGYLSRFKLIGPFAHRILMDILKPPENSEAAGDWPLWRSLGNYQKAGLIPSGCAVGLRCENFLKTRPNLKLQNRNWLIPASKDTMETPISTTVGIFVSKFLSMLEMVQSKQQLCSPQFNSDLANWFSSPESSCTADFGIPILLIQNGTPLLASQKPQCIGWDIVMPRKLTHASPMGESSLPLEDASAPRDLLIACVYRGVRVGGLRDQLHWATITTEAAGRLDAFPYALWPDTPAASLVSDDRVHLQIGRRKDGRLTGDAKRRARIKFRCNLRKSSDWHRLLTDACTFLAEGVQEPFFVLRDKAVLVLVVRRLLAGDPRARHIAVEHLNRYDPRLSKALILVKLEVIARGVPEPGTEIFAPNISDDPFQGPTTEESPRKLLGYVDEGAYAFSHGHCIGLGFISLIAYCSIPTNERHPNGLQTVLLKCPNSKQLHSAKLIVII